jgi:hypothetical protein
MEGLTRLVAESLARHGFDRPVDYRRLNWSRWFRCESPHSLLFVPSKPGVFAIAEEIINIPAHGAEPHVGTAALGCPSERSSEEAVWDRVSDPVGPNGVRLDLADSATPQPRRMLAVLQFGEAEDIAFVLDRTLTRQNPLRDRMAAGRCFVRFVVIEDASQRRSICSALNQWILSSSEKATGIGAHFASSLEFAPITDRVCQDRVGAGDSPAHANSASMPQVPTFNANSLQTAPQPDSGAAANLHCPTPFPSGF